MVESDNALFCQARGKQQIVVPQAVAHRCGYAWCQAGKSNHGPGSRHGEGAAQDKQQPLQNKIVLVTLINNLTPRFTSCMLRIVCAFLYATYIVRYLFIQLSSSIEPTSNKALVRYNFLPDANLAKVKGVFFYT